MAKIYEADITAVTSDRNIEWIKNEFDIENIIDYTKTDITDTSDKYDIIFDANGNLSFPKITFILKQTYETDCNGVSRLTSCISS